MVSIQDFADRLSAIPRERFTRENVLAFMRDNRVDVKTLAPYLFFSGDHYTRNLIRRTPMFELIAICWESGQGSAIHNHCDQRCWMAVPYGKVQVLNFQVVRRDNSTGFCELRPSTHYLIEPDSPQAGASGRQRRLLRLASGHAARLFLSLRDLRGVRPQGHEGGDGPAGKYH